MLFNSLQYTVFLPAVFFFYWFVAARKLTFQNIFLLAASYFFYACWDWRFLFLLLFSTFLDYFTGIRIAKHRTRSGRLFWLLLSITINVGFLGVFKYYNFFAASFAELAGHVGWQIHPRTLQIVLPVGISFYTFHGLSYIIDIYKRKIQPERNFIDYALFVSFFPLLVAGPIERATHLLPQLKRPRTFDYARTVDGLKQILWGLFKKIVIADTCAGYVNMIFADPAATPGSAHLLAAIFFAVQIYCDFSGYSDIALGTARLLGIELLRNFAYPYFSRSIAEFWRRWHISLSTWFRDYLYIPLGGSQVPIWKRIRNVFVIFLVSGFWHGANWTFICWGALNALYILPSVIFRTNRNNLDTVAKGRLTPTPKELGFMIITFALTVLGWIFFRADSVGSAVEFIGKIFSPSIFSPFPTLHLHEYFIIPLLCFFMVEWLGREDQYAIARLGLRWPATVRWATYYAIFFYITYFSSGAPQRFIYFQF
ncbi:MAG TPA: MBOAT family O-acyltransferase [Puia sp.]|jgi:D-alanyl-lipoteichoic acid acyltransferase DltB (MBOAT superfamily)|nr:MBOAT family O-acyltransferase [Puia sp.]